MSVQAQKRTPIESELYCYTERTKSKLRRVDIFGLILETLKKKNLKMSLKMEDHFNASMTIEICSLGT